MIPILAYHAIDEARSPVFTSPSLFAFQIKALAEAGYQTISLSAAVALLKGEYPDSVPKPAVITFDDGYRSVYDRALPILQEHNFTATVFIISDYCGGDNRWPGQAPTVPRRSLLSWDQIVELQAAGWEMGAHTCTHPPLTTLSSEAAEDEIARSKQAIEAAIGREVRFFAYPYGAANTVVKAMVSRHFAGALSTDLGIVHSDSDLYALERIDAYYLTKGIIRLIDQPVLRYYLRARHLLRKMRRLLQTDWQLES